MEKRDIVLLSTADFDNPFWTNKQHQACDFASRGHRVLYVESLGLRRPSASAQDLTRILRRVRKALRGPAKVRENLYVVSPLVLPLQRYAAVRLLNRVALSMMLGLCRLRLRMAKDLLWTYNPMTTRFVDVSGYRQVIYNCVDDIAAQPGMPAQAIREAEEDLCRRSHVVFTTAPALADVCSKWNANTHMVGNVADNAHFGQALAEETEVPTDLRSLPAGPVIGFIGAISGYKVDFHLLRAMALSRPDWQIVLIGKVGEGDPWTDPSLLEGLPNLHLFGPRPYAELPAYLKGFDVAILPCTLNEYTRGMYPMKFNEYLAAGRPVVTVDLPAVRDYRDVARIADSHDDFIAGVAEALEGRCASQEARLSFAAENTYAARTDRMLAIMAAHTVRG